MKLSALLILLMTSQLLSGCAVALFAGAAGTTAAVVSDRRAVGAQVEDHEIEQQITKQINADPILAEHTHVNVISYNRYILLVGQAPSDLRRDQIVNIATQYPGFNDLYNEIRIAENTSAAQRTKDAWLTTKLKTRMLADKELDGHQVKIFTENGEVFLMGLLTEREKKIATTIARNMDGVKRVIEVFEPYEPPAIAENK